MPDLEAYIAECRKQLAAVLGDDPATLDELESHLRDEIQLLTQRGTELQMAVDLAMAKLGVPADLAREFDKVQMQSWWPVYAWSTAICSGLLAILVFLGVRYVETGKTLLWLHTACVSVGYVLSFGVSGLAVLYALRRTLSDLARGQQVFWMKSLYWTTISALAFTGAGFVLGGVWAARNLGHFWNSDPREFGAILVIAWLTVLLAITQYLRWLLCAAILGNLVVIFAWFITPMVQRDMVHMVQSSAMVLTLSIVVVSHLLLVASTIAPVGWLRWSRA
jgi:hypothetical protein